MSLLSRIKSFFHSRQERRQNEIVGHVISSMRPLSSEEQIVKTPNNDLVIKFFRNEADKLIPHRHEHVVNFTDVLIEYCHDYIQWIFPTIKPSMANPDAPTIDNHFAEELCADECAMKNYCKSCRRFLNYMNFDCKGDGQIVNYDRDELFYELPAHNYLRFTRVLDSLNQTGHQQCSKALYEKMSEVMNQHPDAWQLQLYTESAKYWHNTQYSDIQPTSSMPTQH